MSKSRKIQKTVYVADGEHKHYSDFVAIEEPMAIKVNGHYFATVMRTPGRDLDLSVGLLAAEGIVDGSEDISALKECDEDNTVNIALADGCSFDISKARTISVSTACGICGTRSIAALQQELMSAQVMQFDDLSASTLFEAMKVMRNKQELFEQTAATHAVSLLDLETSTTIDIAEDVGRHNAADKVIGKQLLNDNYPFERATAMLVSGRVSFDLVQKAVRANISVVCAVGMPTSLAIESAQAVGIKLFAWAREDRVSLY